MARTLALSIAEVDGLADEIAELAAHIDAASHRLLALIRRFDAAAGWADQGALSCAHWLAWRIGLDLGAAREHVRVARALGSLPLIDDALRAGRVSYSKVRALTRVATASSEAVLLGMARSSTASQLERICRGYRRALRGIGDERPEDEAERRWVRMRETESGMVRIEAQLTAEEAAAVRQALERVASAAWRAERLGGRSVSASSMSASESMSDVPAETPIPAGLRRADALVRLAETYLETARDERAGRRDEAGPPVEIVVHVEAGAAGVAGPREMGGPFETGLLDDGTPLAGDTVERLACDATVVRVVEDSRGNALDVGRRRRTIPTGLRRALRLRDGGCRFPGCTNRLTDGHHVVAWSRGGETRLANLLSLCRRHHRFVHELGYRIERLANGGASCGFAFVDPRGREVRVCGTPPALGSTAVTELLAGNRARGIEINPETSYPEWAGTRPDYDHIVGCLMQGEEQRQADRRGSVARVDLASAGASI